MSHDNLREDVMVSVPASATSVKRFKTAIRRFQPSRPITLALQHGLIFPGITVLDYGCGRGDDVRHLQALGISASGWDPHYHPDNALTQADVVNLGYILNVIEDPTERTAVLHRALELARHLIVIAVRVDRGPQTRSVFNDGMMTTRGRFQKIYSQAEFRSYVETVCGRRLVVAGLGIGYVFKTAEWEAKYLQRTLAYQQPGGRRAAIADFKSSDLGNEYLQLARKLVRLPRPREFSKFTLLREQFGSSHRIVRLATAILDPRQLEAARAARRENFLVYYGMTRLQGLRLPNFGLLPEETQDDILSVWPTFKAARVEGEEFLFSLGNIKLVESALLNAPIGKLVGDALYAHRSIEEQLPPLCRLQIFAARQIVGDPQYDVVKLSANGRKVSFLSYPSFDTIAHPLLSHSLSVYLPKAEYTYRDFSTSDNMPILHRKDTLVDATYPQYQKFAALTRQEEKHGLLSRSDIGHRNNWEKLLSEAGFCIRGHRLIRLFQNK